MIAHAEQMPPSASPPAVQFEDILPKIVTSLRYEFRGWEREQREEAIQEGVASAFVAYQRLVELGRGGLIYPTVLARYAARHVRAGRRVGGHLNSADVSSRYAQRKKGLKLLRLDRYDEHQQHWREAVIDDPRTSVFHQVWFRIDFPAWLKLLSCRTRRIALVLARGHATQDVARKFGLSLARVAQLRRELEQSWRRFQNTAPPISRMRISS